MVYLVKTQKYWRCVDETFELINDVTLNKYSADEEPTESEITKIISEMQTKKSSYGSLSIDLAKLGGK